MAERTVAVEAEGSGLENASAKPQVARRFDDCVFRICSRLNYRAHTELNKINKAMKNSTDPDETKNESAQNEEALGKRHRGLGLPIKYGDVVQLEHRKSRLFLGMHKTPAPVNSNHRKVSLKPGSYAAHFRILPRFKVRSMGSLVYANDEIVLQSTKFEPMVLGGSGMPNDMLASPNASGAALLPAGHGVRLPASLRHGPCFEVNGAVELRSFTVKLYARFGDRDKSDLVTGLHRFRLFHPEGNAFVSASSDADKGEVLDARDVSKQARTRPLPQSWGCRGISGEEEEEEEEVDPVPAHIPYLKTVAGDMSNPANFSAKAA